MYNLRDIEVHYNYSPIEGVPLYNRRLRAYQQWDEARKLLAQGSKRHQEACAVAKDLALADVSMGEFLAKKFALRLDLRTTPYAQLHDSGRRVQISSEKTTLKIT